jgi:hypothetical protein
MNLNKLIVTGAAVMALALASITLIQYSAVNSDKAELIQQYYSQPQFQVAQGQQLPEFEVSGTMETGSPPPQGIPLSFQLPVPLPGPSPPAPNIVTVGPRPKKVPVCKECERQMKKIKVYWCHFRELKNAIFTLDSPLILIFPHPINTRTLIRLRLLVSRKLCKPSGSRTRRPRKSWSSKRT